MVKLSSVQLCRVKSTGRGKRKREGYTTIFFEYQDGTGRKIQSASDAMVQTVSDVMLTNVAKMVGLYYEQSDGWIWVLPGGTSLFDVKLH